MKRKLAFVFIEFIFSSHTLYAPIQERTMLQTCTYLAPHEMYDYNLSKNLSIFLLFFQVGSIEIS